MSMNECEGLAGRPAARAFRMKRSVWISQWSWPNPIPFLAIAVSVWTMCVHRACDSRSCWWLHQPRTQASARHERIWFQSSIPRRNLQKWTVLSTFSLIKCKCGFYFESGKCNWFSFMIVMPWGWPLVGHTLSAWEEFWGVFKCVWTDVCSIILWGFFSFGVCLGSVN